jgi:hypothetical protein
MAFIILSGPDITKDEIRQHPSEGMVSIQGVGDKKKG